MSKTNYREVYHIHRVISHFYSHSFRRRQCKQIFCHRETAGFFQYVRFLQLILCEFEIDGYCSY